MSSAKEDKLGRVMGYKLPASLLSKWVAGELMVEWEETKQNDAITLVRVPQQEGPSR
jgi:hypothetical protein